MKKKIILRRSVVFRLFAMVARVESPRRFETYESSPAVAANGVDLVSVGWLTHSAALLDFGLDFEE